MPRLSTPSPAPALQATSERTWLGWVVGLAVALALLSVAWQRVQGGGPPVDATPVQWQRLLHFQDRPNGDIGVVDAASGQEIARFSGEQGFVRGALRALVRERKRRSLGPEQPFELSGHINGRLTLHDPATGERIALESFGPSNAALFSRLQAAAPVASLSADPSSPASQGRQP